MSVGVAEPKAILFDLDGTILDSTGFDEDWRTTCASFGARGGCPPAAPLLEAIMERRRWLWSDPERDRIGRLDVFAASTRIVSEALASLGCDDAALARTIAVDYRDRRDRALRCYDGALDVLSAVRARGIPMALLTNGAADMQRAKVDRFALDQYFACIVIEGEFGAGKPDERVFRHALEALACDPGGAWMVGDSLRADIEPAHRLGLHTVWIDGDESGLPPASAVQPHRIVGSITELFE